jgi:hypothetical protein
MAARRIEIHAHEKNRLDLVFGARAVAMVTYLLPCEGHIELAAAVQVEKIHIHYH